METYNVKHVIKDNIPQYKKAAMTSVWNRLRIKQNFRFQIVWSIPTIHIKMTESKNGLVSVQCHIRKSANAILR